MATLGESRRRRGLIRAARPGGGASAAPGRTIGAHDDRGGPDGQRGHAPPRVRLLQPKDFDETLATFAPDIDWQVPALGRDAPTRWTGREEVRTFFTEAVPAGIADHQIEVDEIRAVGPHLVAFGRHRGRVSGSGKALEAPFVHVWTYDGDGLATRLYEVVDTTAFA
jgi:ketosteroid isomerase-like protein